MEYKLECHEGNGEDGFDIVPSNSDFNSVGFHVSPSSISLLEEKVRKDAGDWGVIVKKRTFHNTAPEGHVKTMNIVSESDIVFVPSDFDSLAVAYHLAKRYAKVEKLNILDCSNYDSENLGQLTKKLDRLIS